MTPVEAVLTVRLDDVGPDHASARAATADLVADLRSSSEVPLTERAITELGTKGSTIEWVVSLMTPATMLSLTRIVQLWLGRDRRRSLVISVRSTKTGKVIEVTGDRVTVDALTEAAAYVMDAEDDDGSESA